MIFQIPGRFWLMVGLGLATGLIAAAIAFVVSSALPKVWEAQAVVFVGSVTETNPVVLDANQALANKYAGLATTATVLEPAIRALGLDENVAQLSEHVTVRSPEGLSSIDILVSSSTDVGARDLANAIAEEIVLLATPPDAPTSLAWIADPAQLPDGPSSPRILLNTLLGGVLGFVLGMSIGWLFGTRPSEI